jgi:hypothetical protein
MGGRVMVSFTRILRWLQTVVFIGSCILVHVAVVDAQDIHFSPDQGVWDLTGNYPNNEFDTKNNINLIQDDKGRIIGTGTASGTDSGITVNLVYNITGAIKTASDVTRASLIMKISGSASNGSITLPVQGSIKMALELDKVNNILIGSGAGKICAQGQCERVEGPVQFDIPSPMDGSWVLNWNLISNDGGRVGGTATATLSNGRTLSFGATGNTRKRQVRLQGPAGTITLVGDPHTLGLLVAKAKLLGQTVEP